MGAGNQKLKSFDNELFEPKTYFLDLGEDTEEGEEQDYEQDYEQQRANYEDLIETLCSEFEMEDMQEECHDDLCSTFRESGVILVEGKHSYVITETGSEYRNLPIAVIPNFKQILKKLKEWHGDKMTARNGSWSRSKTSEEPTP